MSPELLNPQRFKLEKSRPTKASDCYAFGMVIYETISGHSPFHRDANHTVVLKVSSGEHPPRKVRFSDSLWRILELCWGPQPNARPTIEDVLQYLRMEPPICGLYAETEHIDGWYSANYFSGKSSHLICFAMFHGLPDILISIDEDSDASSFRSLTSSVLSGPLQLANTLGATKENNNSGSLTNNIFIPSTNIHRRLSISQTDVHQLDSWGFPRFKSITKSRVYLDRDRYVRPAGSSQFLSEYLSGAPDENAFDEDDDGLTVLDGVGPGEARINHERYEAYVDPVLEVLFPEWLRASNMNTAVSTIGDDASERTLPEPVWSPPPSIQGRIGVPPNAPTLRRQNSIHRGTFRSSASDFSNFTTRRQLVAPSPTRSYPSRVMQSESIRSVFSVSSGP